MTTDLSRRGKNAKITGDRWEREYRRDFEQATGIKRKRQLTETREANIGDLELHPDVPFVEQCRKRRGVSVWKALQAAEEAADFWTERGRPRWPVGVVQDRTGRNGKPNPRAIIMLEEDWRSMVETFRASDEPAPGFTAVPKAAKVYPRVWDGLEEAKELAGPGSCAYCIGHRKGSDDEGEPLEDVVLVDYDGFLHVVGELYRRSLW